MNDIKVTGRQQFMGKEIPVVYGGFGKDKKCICDKTIALLHNQPVYEIRRRINDNIKRFEENIDLIDLLNVMGESHNNLLQALGYTKMQIAKADHIYLLSQRGYLKLVKIMDSEKAWDTYNQVLDEYFMMKEEKEKDSQNFIMEALTSPEFAIQALQKIKQQKEENAQLQAKIEEDKPKVILADAITVSDTSILVREFAKILMQNKIKMGGNTFYDWLRENGYLIKAKGRDYNTPTQKAMSLKLFEVKETPVHVPYGKKLSFTTYITAKGQQYFINKLKKINQQQLSLLRS